MTIRTNSLQLLHWFRHTWARWTCNDLILTLLNRSLLCIWCWRIVLEDFSKDFTVDGRGCNWAQSQRGDSLSQWFLLVILQLFRILKLFKSCCFTPIYFVDAESARLKEHKDSFKRHWVECFLDVSRSRRWINCGLYLACVWFEQEHGVVIKSCDQALWVVLTPVFDTDKSFG